MMNAEMQIPLLSSARCAVTTDSYCSMLNAITKALMQMLLLSTAYCAITKEGCHSTMADTRKPVNMSITAEVSSQW